jgi:transcriptional regulator with XRE-family HTH domain
VSTSLQAPSDQIGERYLTLIRELPLRPLRSEPELDRAIAMVDALSDRGGLAADETDYLLVLAGLIERYEDIHHSIPEPEATGMLRHHARQRTPAEKSEIGAIRYHFEDRPGREELIARGDIDPMRTTTMAGHFALFRAFAALRRERERKGLSLAEVVQKSGLDPEALGRLESGKDQNPTFEAIARYAAALGLQVDLGFRDRETPPAEAPRADPPGSDFGTERPDGETPPTEGHATPERSGRAVELD